MYLCISGFLIDDSDDDSLKFELDVPKSHEDAVMAAMNWKTFNEGAAGETPLSEAKIHKIEKILNISLPHELALYIGVEA
jgi:hypothetical protein